MKPKVNTFIKYGGNMKTTKYIKDLKENFIRISERQEKAILEYWGKNIGNEFTEQDVWEQTRKVMDNA